MRRRRRHTNVDLSMANEAIGVFADPSDTIALVDLERALRRLGPDDRLVIALRFVAGLDSTEIATQLGGSASGVRSRLARILARLRLDLDHA